MRPDLAFCLIWSCVVPSQGFVPSRQALITALDAGGTESAASGEGSLFPSYVLPSVPAIPKHEPEKIEWIALGRSTLRFTTLMHAFRWATESDTREGGIGLDARYIRSVTNLHGWSDGDPYYINYLGHPAEGSISARIFLNHDPQHRGYEFGANPDYWKGRLRAAVFAWAFSEQFELGLLSEASIGHIQDRFPQQGFVDHVVTPTVGMGMGVSEDAIDRYIIKRLEGGTRRTWMRLLLRTGLNPTRSFANLIDGRAPWHRDTREGIRSYRPQPNQDFSMVPNTDTHPSIAPFEFVMAADYRTFAGTPCVGGGAQAAYRPAEKLQVVLSINGCKLLNQPKNWSGDALLYQGGLRWTPLASSNWSPHAQLLIGGIKLTREVLDPEKKQAVELAHPNPDIELANKLHDQYTSSEETDGLAISAGTGVDYKLSGMLAIRVADFEYSRSTVGTFGGARYSDGFRFSSGILLRIGTW